MLNGHYNGEVRAYLLALKSGNKLDRPVIPPYWRDAVEKAEWSYERSEGDTEVVSRTLSTLSKLNTAPYCDLAELLATERPPLSLARVDGEAPPSSPDAMGSELQAALSTKDMARIQEHISEIAAFDDIKLAKFKMALHNIFGSGFPLRHFEELLRAEKRRIELQSRARPVIKSAYDLMQIKFPEINWIVPGILPPGLITLAGKQKIGKSWLDYNLCLAVATGGKAFGSIPVDEGDVLYLALEDNDRFMQARWDTLLEPGQEISKRIEYVNEWPRMDEFGVAALEQWIQSKPNPRLIIIDPWVKVKPRVKARQGETGYDADYETLAGIKKLADTYNICILIQFHLRKASAEDPMDELNGTSGVTACADGSLFLKRARGESDATLWGTGRGYQEDVDLALKFNNGYWNILGDAKTYALSKESKEVIEALEQFNGPTSPKELATFLGKPDGVIRSRLLKMKNRGEVKDTGEGYIPLIPPESTNAQSANAANGANDDNGANGAVHQAHSVSTVSERYFDDYKVLTLINPHVEPDETDAVSTVSGVSTLCKEALVFLSEVQELFKSRNGIRQMWRDDVNPSRQFLPDVYIQRVTDAIESADSERIQCAITAMKWTTGRLSPGRDKEELASPLQG